MFAIRLSAHHKPHQYMGILRLERADPIIDDCSFSRVVIESLLSKYVLHSLQNAVAKIKYFLETTK